MDNFDTDSLFDASTIINTKVLPPKLVIIAVNVVKSPAVFYDKHFIEDLETFRVRVLAASGCLGVQIIKERKNPCEKFFFISTWESFEVWEPHLGPNYTKRMSDFHEKYLSEFHVHVTEEYIPEVPRISISDLK